MQINEIDDLQEEEHEENALSQTEETNDGQSDEERAEAERLSEIERRARAQGWVPEDEWDEERAKREGRRKPGRFVSAEEYLDRTDSVLPIIRERNRFLEGKLDQTQQKIEDLSRLVESLSSQNVEIGKRAYEKAKREFEAKRAAINRDMEAAVSEADTDRFKQAKEQLASVEAEMESLTPPPEPEQPKVQPKQPVPEVQQWMKENEWFNRDQQLNRAATFIHGELLRESPGLSLSENLAQVSEEVRRLYPKKFENPARSAPSTVASPAPSRQRKNGRSFDDLPRDAKDAYRELAAMFKDRGVEYPKEKYVAEYQWD